MNLDRPKPLRRGRQVAWTVALLGPFFLAPAWAALFGPLAPGKVGTWTGLIVLLLVGTCAWTDLRRRKIPNWATYSAFLWAWLITFPAALVVSAAPAETLAPWQQLGQVGLFSCLLGALVCFFLMLFIYRLSGGG